MRRPRRIAFLFIAIAYGNVLLFAAGAAAGDWPQFRGPDGQGHSSERNLPLTWSDTENVAWATPIPGRGWSSPVVLGNKVWLTTSLDEEGSLRAICIDARSGKITRDVEVFKKDELGPIHEKNSHASPTPVLEGDRVYVHFGAHGTACLSSSGKVLWRNEELKYNHRHGPGGSPVLWRDLLIFSCDGGDQQFVVALDKRTGRVRWRSDREGRMAYCTPLVISVGGVEQVFSPGGDQAIAYAPRTGKELWRFRYDGYSVVPRPVYGRGLVFFSSSYDSPVLYAVRVGGTGDVTDTAEAWSIKRGAPFNPSPLLIDDKLYIVSDVGVATCLEADTGKVVWQQRLGGGFSASPLAADGRIYFTNEEGATTVMAPGDTPQVLAENQIDGRTLSSLGAADGAIFLRTDTALYRIEEKR